MSQELTEAFGKIIAARDPQGFWDFMRATLATLPPRPLPARHALYVPMPPELINRIVWTYLEPHEALIQSTWPSAMEDIIAAYDGNPLAVWKEPVEQVPLPPAPVPPKWERTGEAPEPRTWPVSPWNLFRCWYRHIGDSSYKWHWQDPCTLRKALQISREIRGFIYSSEDRRTRILETRVRFRWQSPVSRLAWGLGWFRFVIGVAREPMR